MTNKENKPGSKRNSELRSGPHSAKRPSAQKSETAGREAKDAGAGQKTATIPEHEGVAGGADRDGQVDVDLAAFPVVGIGASAGGLEASRQFLEHLPTDTGMAFVLVQHLDPKHESLLSEILARATNLPVREVNRSTAIEPDHVYVTPRGMDIRVSRRVLTLSPRDYDSSMQIDFFFRSLAQDLRNKAIGIILSGTGSDGSLGLKAIKAEGGITFAQDEKTAKHDGMPRSAIASGCVDFVLPPEAIAQELARIGRHPYVGPRPAPPEEVIPMPEDGLTQVLHLVRNATGVDLAQYKQNTIKRRVLRRMLLHKFESIDQYFARLKEDAGEVRALYDDILINVTQFFRDSETFETLRMKIFPKI